MLDTLTEDERDIYDVFNLTDKFLRLLMTWKEAYVSGTLDLYQSLDVGKLRIYVDWVCKLNELDLSNNQFNLIT